MCGDDIVLHGEKLPHEKLWPLPIKSCTTASVLPSTNHVISHQHNADFVAFDHATLGSPPDSVAAQGTVAGIFTHFAAVDYKDGVG